MFFSLHTAKGDTKKWMTNTSIYATLKQTLDEKTHHTHNEEPPHDTIIFNNDTKENESGYLDMYLPTYNINKKLLKRLVKETTAIGESNKEKSKEILYELLCEHEIYRNSDEYFQAIEAYVANENLLRFFRDMLVMSDKKFACKLAIQWLGYAKDEASIGEIITFGKFDEYTLFAIESIKRIKNDFESYVFEIAKDVHGWGRLFAIDALNHTQEEEIQSWILHEGFRNNINIQYTALTAARAGKMVDQLKADSPSAETLVSIGEIIESLALQGPIDGLEGYENAFEATKLYLDHTVGNYDHIQHYGSYFALYSFVNNPHFDWSAISMYGWTKEIRQQLSLLLGDELKNRKGWYPLCKVPQIGSSYYYEHYRLAADQLDIDLGDADFDHLKYKGHTLKQWERVLESSSAIEDIVDYAYKSLALDALRNEECIVDQHLITVVSSITEHLSLYPGYGDKFLSAVIHSSYLKHRLMAIITLSQWNKDLFSAELKHAIRTQFHEEKVDGIRFKLAPLLS